MSYLDVMLFCGGGSVGVAAAHMRLARTVVRYSLLVVVVVVVVVTYTKHRPIDKFELSGILFLKPI